MSAKYRWPESCASAATAIGSFAVSPGFVFCQLIPPSVVRYTPSSPENPNPTVAYATAGSTGSTATLKTSPPEFASVADRHVAPPSADADTPLIEITYSASCTCGCTTTERGLSRSPRFVLVQVSPASVVLRGVSGLSERTR